jgi:hypothetical protein
VTHEESSKPEADTDTHLGHDADVLPQALLLDPGNVLPVCAAWGWRVIPASRATTFLHDIQ